MDTNSNKKISSILSCRKQKGFILLTTIILSSALLLTGAAMLTMVDHHFVDAAYQRDEVQAFFLAETGAEEAIWYLQNIDSNWVGDTPTEHVLNNGTYVINIDHSGAPVRVITVTGYVPDITNARVQKTIEVTGVM